MILAGDIGGTSTRLGFYDIQGDRPNLVAQETFPSRTEGGLEAIIRHYPGDRNAAEFQDLLLYAKQMWFSNGIHHHIRN